MPKFPWGASGRAISRSTNFVSSSAAGSDPIWYATVVSIPCVDRTISLPVCSKRNDPVPYVHFASPGLKQV